MSLGPACWGLPRCGAVQWLQQWLFSFTPCTLSPQNQLHLEWVSDHLSGYVSCCGPPVLLLFPPQPAPRCGGAGSSTSCCSSRIKPTYPLAPMVTAPRPKGLGIAVMPWQGATCLLSLCAVPSFCPCFESQQCQFSLVSLPWALFSAVPSVPPAFQSLCLEVYVQIETAARLVPQNMKS